MFILACAGKIHRATVTQAELNYVGSITIAPELLAASGIRPGQYVNVTSCANGVFWRTYALAGEPGKGQVCLNGPPARHFQPGDKVIILAECMVTPEEFETLQAKVVFADDHNKVGGVRLLLPPEPMAVLEEEVIG